MSVKQMLIEIGWDKNGQMDFGVSGLVGDLTPEQMNDFRSMIPVAIGQAENMWRRYRETSGLTAEEVRAVRPAPKLV